VGLKHKAQCQRSKNHADQIRATVAKMEKIEPREIRDRSGRIVGHVVAKATKDIEGYTSGLIKVEKQYNKTKQSTYMTFRIVSDNSDQSDWMHPGYAGLGAFDAAEEMLDDRMDNIINVIFGR